MEELPSHIMVDILSRLPVKTIVHCNCVCKSWRDLVSDSHFADIHLLRSPAGLMIHHMKDMRHGLDIPGVLRWVEIKDELDHQRLHHDPVMNLDLGLAPVLRDAKLLQVGSVNGLMCFWEFGPNSDNTYICNPITREYLSLPRKKYYKDGHANGVIIYGFGVGLQTKEYKVIRTFRGRIPPKPCETSRQSLGLQNLVQEAEVYTIGTGQWRSLGHVPYCLSGQHGPFLNGNAHWFLLDKDSREKLFTFNFDKETFQLFPSPPCDAMDDEEIDCQSLSVLKGCLCQCDTYYAEEFRFWVMKEYGVKKSWHKVVVIATSVNRGPDWELWDPVYPPEGLNSPVRLNWDPVYPVEGLNDGSILMVYYGQLLFKCCLETKTIETTELFERYFNAIAYRPSFLRLERFESERAQVF
ncbi:hypothetical protein SSX86_006699 [Deinandra increscens subsp. villosa]|uniref:F-box domain-containing protein n=1 Tax=Deinandra increscens subsp. villosa TaxID=3103831 RepID=A0AAP0DK09_9ASTR